jgi:hypothetical protein
MCKVRWTGHAWLSHYTWASQESLDRREKAKGIQIQPWVYRILLCNRVLSLSFPFAAAFTNPWCNKCPCSIEFKSRSISTYSSIAVVLSFLLFSLPGRYSSRSSIPFFLQVARDGWSLSLNVTSSEELPRGDLQYPFFFRQESLTSQLGISNSFR